MDEITLVTAYFNIGRGAWTEFNRDNGKYLSYFAHWARLRNRLVVYTSPDIAEKVQSIRQSFGLGARTTVISVPDVSAVQPELYLAIRKTMQNKISWLFHKKLDHPEAWNYDYNYVTNLKTYWVQDAVARGLTSNTAAWIDFGYDHGGDDFPYAEDFDFLWQYDFSPLIHIFLAKQLDEKPIFKIVQDMDTYLRGGLVIAPASLWKPLWLDIHQALHALSACGLADDDQTLLLMAYRHHPENFQTHTTTFWGEPLYAYGGNYLRLRDREVRARHIMHQRMKQFLQKKRLEWDIRQRKGGEIERHYFK